MSGTTLSKISGYTWLMRSYSWLNFSSLTISTLLSSPADNRRANGGSNCHIYAMCRSNIYPSTPCIGQYCVICALRWRLAVHLSVFATFTHSLSWVYLSRTWRLIHAGIFESVRGRSLRIDFVQGINRELQEVMLIFPCDFFLGESLTLLRRWRWIGYFGNKICSWCLSNSVHEHADKWRFQHDCKGKCETEQNTLTVKKPSFLLIFVELDTREIWFKLIERRDMYQ